MSALGNAASRGEMPGRNIVFVIPDENKVYENVSVKVGAFHLPSLAFAILGAIARQNRFSPVILDLTLEDSESSFDQRLKELNPIYVGISATSASYFLAMEVAKMVRAAVPKAGILIGGTHASSLPEETLETGLFDFVFIGEAEYSFDQFLKGAAPEKIDGIAFRDAQKRIQIRRNSGFLRNLDAFPFPDYSLYDLSKYHIAKLHSRQNPVLWVETSRGCPFDCKICNKVVHGQNFRPKSVDRIIAEMEYYRSLGVRELHIADDGFTSNMDRAEKICDLMLKKGFFFSWSCINGIRVDRISEKLLRKMKEAGCYRISFGIESGNQSVLDNLGKRISLSQIKKAVRLAKRIGFEVFGYFIFGFFDDTEKTMQETIDFSRKLPLDLAKASVLMPFPGSPLHDECRKRGLLFPTEDYRYYNAYLLPQKVYKHPTLDWEVILDYQTRFYRSFYLNPVYMIRRFIHSLKTGTIWQDLQTFLHMEWFKKSKK